MDYYSMIKPTLNKLSKLEVLDSLDVVRKYVKYSLERKDKALIPGIKMSEANSIEIWYADFMIVNIIKYCQVCKGSETLRDVNTRHKICTPIHDLSTLVDHEFIDDNPWLWISSYMFNQAKMKADGNLLIIWYRYYYLYNSPLVRQYAERKIGVGLDVYFGMAFYVYCSVGIGERFGVSEDYFIPIDVDYNQEEMRALNYILSSISKTLPEMKQLCKNYCKYDDAYLFRVYDDAPHIMFPLLKDGKRYYCVRPDYILSPLLDGLYYKLDIPSCENSGVRNELARNLEKYTGMIFNHFFASGKIQYRSEITYDDENIKSQRTSDWILWDEQDLCFIDCKMKRISIKAKHEAIINEDAIDMVVGKRPFTVKAKREVIEKGLPSGLTKDLINLGVDLGKIYVSYDKYRDGRIKNFPYMEGKRFHAVILTLKETFSNVPGYKSIIVKVAQSYRDYYSGNTEVINEDDVKILSLSRLEENAVIIAKIGLGEYFRIHRDMKALRSLWEKDEYLLNKCDQEIIQPLIERLKKYKFRSLDK